MPMTDKPRVRVLDDPSVREVVATDAVTGLLTDGTLLVTLAARRALPETSGAPPSQAPAATVTARLALTPTAAVELVNLLNGLLSAVPGLRLAPTAPPTTHDKPQ